MLDKIIGLTAIVVLIAFMGILVGYVPSLDLVIIISIVVLMAAYDFYRALFKRRNGGQ
jgi:hypothetical protein